MLIKQLRQQKHLSQQQLAERCDLSLRTVQRAESGHRVGYASLRALAKAFDTDADSLERELYSMDKIVKDYQDFPLWLRLYIGSGWFTASRKEFQKIELFFLVVGSFCGLIWLTNTLWVYAPQLPQWIQAVGTFAGFFGAYNSSVTIRVGDKYDIWSRLESTLPRGVFGFFKKK
ncbi:MAG: transcriptional regulator with XRE-family HTH domain [Phenylobacterium sp.]|jgi:transcriptional regulator with XRE-family HTH domain